MTALHVYLNGRFVESASLRPADIVFLVLPREEVAVEQGLDLRDKQTGVKAVLEGLLLLHEGDGLLDLVDVEVFFGEDEEIELVEIAIEAVVHLVHLDFEDALQGQGQGPIFVLVTTDDVAVAQAVGITRLVDVAQVVGIHLFDVLARHLVHQGVIHILVLSNGAGDLDTDASLLILQIRPVAVDQMRIRLAQQCSQRDHSVALKETGIEFRGQHFRLRFDMQK